MQKKKKTKTRSGRYFRPLLLGPSIRGRVWNIGLGWGLAFLAVLALLNFHPIVKTEVELKLPWNPILILFLVGLGVMVSAYRGLSEKKLPELGRRTAWSFLGVILAAGAFLRLYNLGHAPGPFWDDWATNFVWVHQILDKNKFFWMMPSDGIEPFVPYCMAALMGILPDEVKDIVVRRIAATLIDLAAIWVLYLCGKELGSKRTGLLAAALGALGRPMIQLTITGMRAFSLSLAVSLLILTSLKLFRKPNLKHFLWWGLSIAFGAHTYSSFRVFMLAVPFLILPWVLNERRKYVASAAAGWGALGSIFLLMGVYSGTFSVTFPSWLPWSAQWNRWSDQNGIMLAIFLAAFAPSLYAVWKTYRGGFTDRLAGWSLGLGISCLLIYPMTLSDQFNGRMGVLSPFRDPTTSQNILLFLTSQISQTFLSLFYACRDRADLVIATDPFYDLFSQGALLFGIAFFLAKPDWRKSFLLALAALGTAVYVISFDPASTKLIGSAPPLYLLAAGGTERAWKSLSDHLKGRSLSWVPIVLLLAYGAWGAVIQFEKIHFYWAKNDMLDVILSRQVEAEERRYRVYLAPSDYFFGWNSQAVLNEGKRYYILKDTNNIPMVKDEAPPDAVIYIYGSNDKLIGTMKEQFPSAQWDKIYVFPHSGADPNPELYMWRVLVAGTTITEDPGAVLYFKKDEGGWIRRYYNFAFGWGLPGILCEERIIGISDPFPEEWLRSKAFEKFNYAKLVQMTGPIEVDRDGKYQWTVQFANPFWLRVDGETLCRWDSPGSKDQVQFEKYLRAGTHQVEILARFPQQYDLPIIRWSREGAADWKNL